ncbi:hypothetical protein SB781_36805, partial [Paraburkholderia sp. SIMBA_061]
GGSQMPNVVVMGGENNSSVPFLFNLGDLADIDQDRPSPEEASPLDEPSPFEDNEEDSSSLDLPSSYGGL